MDFFLSCFAKSIKNTEIVKREREERKSLAMVDILCEYLIEVRFHRIFLAFQLMSVRFICVQITRKIKPRVECGEMLFINAAAKILITSHCGCAFDCLLTVIQPKCR